MASRFYVQSSSDDSGTTLQFPNHNIRIVKCIGEGSYSHVHLGIDIQNNKKFAIKKTSTQNERFESMTRNEIKALKCLKSKSYIIEIFDQIRISGRNMILLEYCPISLLEYIQKRNKLLFEDAEIVKLLGQITKAVEHMHSLDPPLINRDLKIENILLSDTCLVRICDFGSATWEKIDPSVLNYSQKCIEEKNVEESTTPACRSPEMLDFFLNYIIDEKADIWALGSIYYFVCYLCYPFEGGPKLAILNLKYDKTKSGSEFVESCINPLIDGILVINPNMRPTVFELSRKLEYFSNNLNISIDDPIFELNHSTHKVQGPAPSSKMEAVFYRAGTIIDSLKETGHKLKAHINQSAPKKMKSTNMLTYVTSRLAFAPYPTMNFVASLDYPTVSAELLAESLINISPENFVLINLVNSPEYSVALFQNRVTTFDMSEEHAPDILEIFELIRRVSKFLSFNQERIVVFHAKGEYLCCFVICTILVFSRAFSNFKDFFERFLYSRRDNDINISPAHASFVRYGQYVEYLSNNPRFILENSPFTLSLLTITPVFFCNRTRKGIRPFITMHIGGNLVYSTLGNPSELREYGELDGKIEIPLGVVGYGNVKITAYHASVIDTKYYQKKLFGIQFHTSFIRNQSLLRFEGPELDVFSASLFTSLYKTKVEIHVSGTTDTLFPRLNLIKDIIKIESPIIFFSNLTELETMIKRYKYDSVCDFINIRIQSLINKHSICDEKINLDKNIEHINTEKIIDMEADCEKPHTNKAVPEEDRAYVDELTNIFTRQFLATSNKPSCSTIEPLTPKTITPEELNIPFKKETKEKISENLAEFDFIHFHDHTRNRSKSSEVIPPTSTKSDDLFEVLSESFSDYVSPANNYAPVHKNIDFKPSVSGFSKDSNKNSPTSFSNIFDEPIIPTPSYNPFTSNPFVNKKDHVSDNIKSDSPPSNTHKSPPTSKNLHNPDNFLDDILLNHGFTSSTSPAVKLNKPTLNEAKRMQDELLDRDPVAKLIKSWSLGKGKNIRALLSTLHTIIWCPDKWNPVNLYNLSDYDSIRKCYRKACLLVHPDKQINSPHAELAKAIFCELNDAWNAFQSSGGKVFK